MARPGPRSCEWASGGRRAAVLVALLWPRPGRARAAGSHAHADAADAEHDPTRSHPDGHADEPAGEGPLRVQLQSRVDSPESGAGSAEPRARGSLYRGPRAAPDRYDG